MKPMCNLPTPPAGNGSLAVPAVFFHLQQGGGGEESGERLDLASICKADQPPDGSLFLLRGGT
jgi:hypothetical protein